MTPYPYILILGQDDNERMMGEQLREWAGSAVEHRTRRPRAVAGSCHGDAARATARCARSMPRGSPAATARAARCASVRHRFAGAPYEHVFFVADVEATGSMVPDEVNVYLWRKGFHLFFPMRGKDHWRIVGILPPALQWPKRCRFR